MSYGIGFEIFAKDKAAAVFDKLGKKVDETDGKFAKHKKAIIAGSAVAAAAIIKFGADSIGAYKDAEAQQRKLTDAYSRFPAMADVSIDALRNLAQAQQSKTKFDGDDIAASMGVLGQYKLTGKQIQQMTPLLLDYAEKTGKDLPTATKAMGLAMMGNAKAMKEIGINIPKATDATKELGKAQDRVKATATTLRDAQQKLSDLQAIQAGKDKLTIQDQFAMRDAKQKVKDATDAHAAANLRLSRTQAEAGKTGDRFAQITDGLRKQVGGFAEKEGKSAEGRAEILKNKFGDLQENVGAKLVPAMIKMTNAGIKVVDWMGNNTGKVKVLAIGFGALVTVLVVAKAITMAQTAAMSVMAARSAVIAGATKAWAAAQWLMNVALTANPIGIVVMAIAALVVGLIIAYKKSETFRSIVTGAFDAISNSAKWMWNNVVAPVIRFLLNAFATVASFYASMLRGLSKVPGFGWAKTAADLMDKAAGKARDVAKGVNSIPNKKKVVVEVSGRVTSGQLTVNGKKVNLGMFAKGGQNLPKGWRIAGEEGPELQYSPGGDSIIPAAPTKRFLDGGRGSSRSDNAGGGDQNITVQLVLDGKVVQQSLLKLKRQGGVTLGLA